MMSLGKPVERFSSFILRLPLWCLMLVLALSGSLALNSRADYSDRRQVIVFATPNSESAKVVQLSVDALRCQLVDRDTDVRFVDITELPDASGASTAKEHHAKGALAKLARLRGDGLPEFELLLIGKDGGVKARTSDPAALQDFLALIDTMPMRRNEVLSHGGADAKCESEN